MINVAITINPAGITTRKSINVRLKITANKIMPIDCSGSIFFIFSSKKSSLKMKYYLSKYYHFFGFLGF